MQINANLLDLQEQKKALIIRAKIKNIKALRGVAQLASALAWGASGRPFESVHPD